MEMRVTQVPSGVYKIEIVVEEEQQLGGYCWVVPSGSSRYEYYVMRQPYLPPVQNVDELIFDYDASMPSTFTSLEQFLALATKRIHDVFPEAEVDKAAFVESETEWELP